MVRTKREDRDSVFNKTLAIAVNTRELFRVKELALASDLTVSKYLRLKLADILVEEIDNV